MNDYVPDSHVNRLNFFINLKAQIIADAGALNWDAAKTAAAVAVITPLITVYQTLVDAEAAATQAAADASQGFAQGIEALRALVAEIKTTPGFTDGMGEAMKIFTEGTKRQPADIKPRIKVESQPGHVRVTGTKDYAQLFNVYMRRVGTVAWILVATNRKKFPFDDQTPLVQPGVPEQREYRACGVINDEEVGQFSDVVLVTFNG